MDSLISELEEDEEGKKPKPVAKEQVGRARLSASAGKRICQPKLTLDLPSLLLQQPPSARAEYRPQRLAPLSAPGTGYMLEATSEKGIARLRAMQKDTYDEVSECGKAGFVFRKKTPGKKVRSARALNSFSFSSGSTIPAEAPQRMLALAWATIAAMRWTRTTITAVHVEPQCVARGAGGRVAAGVVLILLC